MSKNPLSKNFVYKDKPRNELEGLLANMHGENYPVEAKNGLIKEASKITHGSGSSLPAVTNADNGKVLSVVDGAWAADDNRFVVNCTPTAADYSGTMDKTAEEIKDAFLLGRQVYFSVANIGLFLANSLAWNTVGTTIIDTANNRMIRVYAYQNNTYSTKIFDLTPLGS